MIKQIFLIFGLIFLVAVPSFGQIDWKEYEFKSHHFKINFPQIPIFSVDTSSFEGKSLFTYNWEVNISDTLHSNNYYGISVVSYPSTFIHSDSSLALVEGFINSTQSGLLDDKDYTFLSATLTEKQGFPGKVYRWKTNTTNIFFQFEIFLIENTLYQLSVVSREGENHNKSINNYFDSFEIVNHSKGKFSIPKISNAKNYIIDFPGTPKDDYKTIDSEYGKLSLNIQSFEPSEKSDNMIYMATEVQYPPKAINQDDTFILNSFYKKSIDGSLSSINGQLISINDIYYNNRLGKEYKCYFSGGKAIVVYRIFYIDDYLYLFGVISLPDKDKNEASKVFLESFKIKK